MGREDRGTGGGPSLAVGRAGFTGGFSDLPELKPRIAALALGRVGRDGPLLVRDGNGGAADLEGNVGAVVLEGSLGTGGTSPSP